MVERRSSIGKLWPFDLGASELRRARHPVRGGQRRGDWVQSASRCVLRCFSLCRLDQTSVLSEGLLVHTPEPPSPLGCALPKLLGSGASLCRRVGLDHDGLWIDPTSRRPPANQRLQLARGHTPTAGLDLTEPS